MARPQKCGMDYFPHDTDALTDEKIEALRMLYGNDGYAFYFILLERIYRTENFELDISDAETVQILSRKIGITEEQFIKMLNTSLKRNCFDNDIYEQRKCLTSNGIKKRADVVISKRLSAKETYNKRVSATETIQEIKEETPQKVHKGEESKDKGKKKTFLSDSNEYRLAELLDGFIKTRNPKRREPDLQAWSSDIDKMMRIDNRTADEVEFIIRWCQKSNFWQNNILSASKLREKYDQLYLKANEKQQIQVVKNKQTIIDPSMIDFIPGES